VDAEFSKASTAARTGDGTYILTHCAIGETPALNEIARAVGFKGRTQYEAAILQLLRDDETILHKVRTMFGGLTMELEIS
jgi:hypothetical protein